MIQLRPYQEEFVNDILYKINKVNKVMCALSTGGGKTYCFSFIVDYLIKRNKRILILVHKEELVTQTVKSLAKFSVISESITSRVKKPKHFANAYVAMERTAFNRLNKNPDFFRDVDYVIADEAHILSFGKVFDKFDKAKILGFTGTPVHQKRVTFFKCETCRNEYQENTECCGSETMEWSRPFAFSQIYDNIVVGSDVNELIELGNLVKEIPIVKKSVNLDKLKTDASGEFTEKSQAATFEHPQSIDALVDDYMKLCKGKKTMIFTPSTKINPLINDKLIALGISSKMYDSVNNEENRKELVKWFEDEKEGVLINSNVFTTGFDVTDVECIIMYRATTSLSLFIQIVGRGARSTKKIYKDSFLLIDYGENIDRHGLWSDPTRDWEHIFKNGIGETKPKKETIEAVDYCENCGALIPKSVPICPECSAKIVAKKKKEVTPDGYKLVPVIDLPPPNGDKIVAYAKKNNEGTAFAFRIMMNQICDLFRFYGVEKELYEATLANGKLDLRINEMVRKCYFVIIRSGLKGANRTLNAITEKTKEKISKLYC